MGAAPKAGNVGKVARPPVDVSRFIQNGQLTDLARNSPFIDLESPMTGYEWFKLTLLSPLALVRGIVSFVGIALAWLCVSLVLLGHPATEPLPKWKSYISRGLVRFWGTMLLTLGGSFWPTVKGWDNVAKAEEVHAVLCFNHVSYVDALVLASLFAPCGVAKADVATLPFIGTITRGLQFLFIERRGTTDTSNQYTVKGDAKAAVLARQQDLRYPLFMIAPEATTKPGHCLLRFSQGAFSGGRPVMPVLLSYRANKHLNPGWGLTESTPWHFLRLLCQFVNYVSVEALEVYYPSADEKADPALYAENVRKIMGAKLKAPLVTYSTKEEFPLKVSGLNVDWTGKWLQLGYGKKRKRLERITPATKTAHLPAGHKYHAVWKTD